MGRLYLNEKEVMAMLIVLETYISKNPDSSSTEFLAKVPERLRKVWELQHEKKQPTTKK